jgi:hypothetical protein
VKMDERSVERAERVRHDIRRFLSDVPSRGCLAMPLTVPDRGRRIPVGWI